MERDQDPVTDGEIAAVQAEMAEQQQEIREALAGDFGGEPEDYSAKNYFRGLGDEDPGEVVPDGGD